ncbi:PAS domain-containing protein [Pseudoduganella chitinolytica]|uniref:PAS domain-containing protein n=1 Tax=Pseudoduganella chitinolytica TaxID=34070 RepID=A0ABY8BIG3_9BURK|nr:PAS domain-containing protein [Pseudoduganella chitinolytica]WEF35456.1 PAS domain-containing protein [Pseudoduganella chitinolytica]
MDIQVLAATADRTERRMLRQLLGNLPDDVDRMMLRFITRLRPAGRPVPLQVPDILMLDAAAAGPGGPPFLAALTAPGAAIPVILLVAAPAAGVDLGAAQVVLAQASRQLLRALIASIVASARAAMPGDSGAAVLAAIADAVISTGTDGKITYCNPAAERLMQLNREQMLGSPVASLMLLQDPATLRPLVHPIVEALARGQTIRLQAGCILVRPDGSEIMIDDSTAPIAKADGTLSGAVMVFHDITEARELQAQVDYLACTTS